MNEDLARVIIGFILLICFLYPLKKKHIFKKHPIARHIAVFIVCFLYITFISRYVFFLDLVIILFILTFIYIIRLIFFKKNVNLNKVQPKRR